MLTMKGLSAKTEGLISDASVSGKFKHQSARGVRTLGIRRALPAVVSTEVLRRMYGKDNRVLYSAKFSQSFEVVPAKPSRQGARFFTG